MSEFELERRRWSEEVDAEAAHLLRQGVPPYEAIDRAREIVSARRRRQPVTNAHLSGDIQQWAKR